MEEGLRARGASVATPKSCLLRRAAPLPQGQALPGHGKGEGLGSF